MKKNSEQFFFMKKCADLHDNLQLKTLQHFNNTFIFTYFCIMKSIKAIPNPIKFECRLFSERSKLKFYQLNLSYIIEMFMYDNHNAC